MSTSRPSRTATGAALCRFLEQRQPESVRQFSDPIVERLLDPMITMLAGPGLAERLLASIPPGIYGCQVMRTRFLDEVVTSQAHQGITQLVVLGAGLDTRAFRLAALASVIVFEADLPTLQHTKRSRLRGLTPLAKQVRFVPIDFTHQSLAAELDRAGFDASRPALFLWEGVTQYLTGEAVRSTLAVIGAAAPGSVLAFSYVLPDQVGGNPYSGWTGPLGLPFDSTEPWLFGLAPQDVATTLAAFQLRLITDVGAEYYQARYLRPIQRQLEVSPVERLAVALR